MITHLNKQPSPPSRVVVLGAGGFLGRRLVACLQERGCPVLGITRNDFDFSASDAGAQLAQRLTEGGTLVFLAAITRERGHDVGTLMHNLAMGQAVCEATAAAPVSHLVYASSDAVYPFAAEKVSEETPSAPTDLYGVMHLARETMLSQALRTPLAILRLTAIYGPDDTHNSYGPNRFIREALQNGQISLFGNGEETRDHLYINDAVEILWRVIAHRSTGMLNVASGHSIAFGKLAEMVTAICPNTNIKSVPRKLPVTHRHFQIGNLKAAFPDVQFTDLRAGLRATIAGAQL
jgi:nucleoside-diphosphate-sugar epimerase